MGRRLDFDNPKSCLFVVNFALARYLVRTPYADQNQHLPRWHYGHPYLLAYIRLLFHLRRPVVFFAAWLLDVKLILWLLLGALRWLYRCGSGL